MINFGAVPAGSVLPVFFATYGKTNGESITLTGLAVTDIEIYKGTSITQRASDAGYALIDTDGIDVDGVTGIHAFSIDTGDNTDSGFYSVGSFFTVVVSAVTVDSQTVNFVAATFRLVAAEHTAGYPVATIKDGTGTGEIDTTSGGVLVAAIAANAITATSINADAFTAAKFAADVTTEFQSGLATAAALATVDGIVDEILLDTAEIGAAGAGLTAINLPNQTMDIVGNITGNLSGSVGSVTGAVGSVTGAVGSVTGNVGGNVTGSVGSVAAGGIAATSFAANAITAAKLDPDVTTELQSGLATAADLATVATYIDTEVAAIKAKTDQLTFGVANTVNTNVTYVNEIEVDGAGTSGDPWGPV